MRKLLLTIASIAMALSAGAQGWPAYYDGVMLQSFWWDGYNATKWAELTSKADELSTYFDLIWIPNAGTSSGDVYAINEYNQGNTDAINWSTQMGYMPCLWLSYNTIFGTEQELYTMIDTYKAKGTGIIEDVVINHKNGVTGWCDFANETATGRVSRSQYQLTWDNETYSGICNNDEANYNNNSEGQGKITGNNDTGDGFDGCRDLDHTNAQVQQNVKTYLDYLLNEVGFAGFRYDMVKGYNASYTSIYNKHAQPRFSVGEYWDNTSAIRSWIDGTNKTSAAFDFGLKTVINSAFDHENYGALADKSLAADSRYQRYAVTFVDNHDTGTSTRDDGETETGDCPLQNNWSAANALILALPGTPCVWYYHYKADPSNIQNMILARKACGLNNQCTIIKQETTGTGKGYRLETQGTTGSVYCQFGDATGEGTPSGYTQVASGYNYKFYQKVDAEVLPLYSPVVPTDNEVSVFCETAASSLSIWAWGDNGNYTGGNWNTKPQMKKMGKAENGKNIFKWTYSGSLTGMPSGLIFVYSDGTETANLNYSNHGYYQDATLASTVVTNSEAGHTLYFDPAGSGWSDVYCYTWRSNSEEYVEPWPGVKLTEQTASGLYKATIDNNSYDRVIFSNGNGGVGNQTADLVAYQGHIYNAQSDTQHKLYELNDGTAILPSMAGTYDVLDYTRTYSGKWQALYIPFALPYSAWGNDFEIAVPTSCDGSLMNYRKLGADEATEANGIYFIKAKQAGTKTLTLANTTVTVPENDTELDVNGYTFHGTSTGVACNEWNPAWYAMGVGGSLAPTNATDLTSDAILLKAQRWYLKVPAGASANLRLEEGDAEGIESIAIEPEPTTIYYDLQGRIVSEGTKGFLIVNGKKCIIM